MRRFAWRIFVIEHVVSLGRDVEEIDRLMAIGRLERGVLPFTS